MPYIKQKDRSDLQPFSTRPAETMGELNFQVTALCNQYLLAMGSSYEHLNALVGMLECAKLEFYRRAAAPYEDTKIRENGDVYP